MRTFIITPFTLLIILLSLPAHADDCQRAVEVYNKGTLSNELKEKERLFQEAIPLCSDPEVLSRIYNNLADVYEKMGEFSKALTHYKKAMQIKRDLATPYLSTGDIFFRRRRPNTSSSLKVLPAQKPGFFKKHGFWSVTMAETMTNAVSCIFYLRPFAPP